MIELFTKDGLHFGYYDSEYNQIRRAWIPPTTACSGIYDYITYLMPISEYNRTAKDLGQLEPYHGYRSEQFKAIVSSNQIGNCGYQRAHPLEEDESNN